MFNFLEICSQTLLIGKLQVERHPLDKPSYIHPSSKVPLPPPVFVCATKRMMAIVSVAPSRNYLLIGAFSTILTLLKLSSLALNSVYIGLDKSAANSIVNSMVNRVSVCTLFGWHIKFAVLVHEVSDQLKSSCNCFQKCLLKINIMLYEM